MNLTEVQHLLAKLCLTPDYVSPKHDLMTHLTSDDTFFKKSAVTVPIVNNSQLSKINSPSILLTQRQEFLRSHAGQISFPGGKFDSLLDKSLINTAQRECEEEVGIAIANNTLVQPLHLFNTLTGYSIQPYITQVSATVDNLKINKNEVAKIIYLPIPHLLTTQAIYIKYVCRVYQQKKVHFPVYFLPFGDHLIWGATAGILIDFASRIIGPTRIKARLVTI